MNKKLLPTVLAGAVLIGTLALSNAFAGPGYGKCDELDSSARQEKMAERMDRHLAKMTTVLELNETQQTQIKEILANKQEARQDQVEQRCEDRQQMQKLKSAATFDETAFRALAEKHAAQRIDRQVEKMKTKQQIFALLTAEQQEKADVLFQAMGKRGSGHGRGMHH